MIKISLDYTWTTGDLITATRLLAWNSQSLEVEKSANADVVSITKTGTGTGVALIISNAGTDAAIEVDGNDIVDSTGKIVSANFDTAHLPLAGGTMTGAILVNTADTHNLGSATVNWNNVYLNILRGRQGNPTLRIIGATDLQTARDIDIYTLGASLNEVLRLRIGSNAAQGSAGITTYEPLIFSGGGASNTTVNIRSSGSDRVDNIPTGGTYIHQINGATETTLSATALDLNGNVLTGVGAGTTDNAIQMKNTSYLSWKDFSGTLRKILNLHDDDIVYLNNPVASKSIYVRTATTSSDTYILRMDIKGGAVQGSAGITCYEPLAMNGNNITGIGDITLTGATSDISMNSINNAANVVWTTRVSGDGGSRHYVECSGKHEWGAGSGATDTNLYRGGVNLLITDDALTIAGTLNNGALTASRALYADASKNITSSAVTDTELGYVSGVTSAIQTQINARSKSASSSYAGDSTVNKAIAHGLGVAPKLVIILTSAGNFTEFKIVSGESGQIHYLDTSPAQGIYAVTAVDATNFYVGNATNYANSANATGTTYYWAAVG